MLTEKCIKSKINPVLYVGPVYISCCHLLAFCEGSVAFSSAFFKTGLRQIKVSSFQISGLFLITKASFEDKELFLYENPVGNTMAECEE